MVILDLMLPKVDGFEVCQLLRRRGVKGYVTFNTLVFDEEWEEAARALEAIAELALQRKIGARGLRMIIEDLMLDLMYSVPGQKKLREVVVTREIVEAFALANRLQPGDVIGHEGALLQRNELDEAPEEPEDELVAGARVRQRGQRERMDWPDPAKLKAAIENTKGYHPAPVDARHISSQALQILGVDIFAADDN